MMSIVDNIKSKLDKNELGCDVFIDLEKAFDTVNQKILLQKLKHYARFG